MQVPGIPRLTVGMIAAHIHNSRCGWIRSLGARHGVSAPPRVDLRQVRPGQLLKALSRSSRGMTELIRLGVAHGGRVPRATWQNFPTDLEHFLSYFAAHEGHHRGQICMAVRQLGRRLPREVANGIWQWTRLAREPGAAHSDQPKTGNRTAEPRQRRPVGVRVDPPGRIKWPTRARR
jgi:uncharacterized damage-inducible protein DinB